jgi:hypothetical protein
VAAVAVSLIRNGTGSPIVNVPLTEAGLNEIAGGGSSIVKSYGTCTVEPPSSRENVPLKCPDVSVIAGCTVIEYEPLLFAVTDVVGERTLPGSAKDTCTGVAKGVYGITTIVSEDGDPAVNDADKVLGVSV